MYRFFPRPDKHCRGNMRRSRLYLEMEIDGDPRYAGSWIWGRRAGSVPRRGDPALGLRNSRSLEHQGKHTEAKKKKQPIACLPVMARAFSASCEWMPAEVLGDAHEMNRRTDTTAPQM
jgi:hypothetical protein